MRDGRSLANFFRTPEADRQASGGDPISALAARLSEGAIAAVKGLGGYHLVCDAGNERAVAALRARKHREDKPFALMVADCASARRMVALDVSAETLLLLRGPADRAGAPAARRCDRAVGRARALPSSA